MSGTLEKPEEKDNGWLEVFSDGASRGNPGPAGIGGVAKDPQGRILAEVYEFLGDATNNVAEYQALIHILEASIGLGYSRVKIHTDSELLANQLAGGFRIKSKALMPLVGKVKSLLSGFRHVQVEHIPREKNSECDMLANRAIDEGLSGLRRPVLSEGGGSLF